MSLLILNVYNNAGKNNESKCPLFFVLYLKILIYQLKTWVHDELQEIIIKSATTTKIKIFGRLELHPNLVLKTCFLSDIKAVIWNNCTCFQKLDSSLATHRTKPSYDAKTPFRRERFNTRDPSHREAI